jgi:hypothetical protein
MATMHTDRLDPDHLDEARASLIARIEELGRRLHAARERLDLPAHIVAHPLAAVGIAFAAGALLGMRRRRPITPGDGPVERSFARVVAAGIGALALRVGKEIAFKQAADYARGWWSAREAAASREPQMETFFRH